MDDLRAAGVAEKEICSRDWFGKLLRNESLLSHVTIASGKENFGKCDDCLM